MAKSKNEVVEVAEETAKTAKVDWQALALSNEKKVYEALERVEKLEEVACRVLPELHLAAKYFHAVQTAAGTRIEKLFIELRELLGEKGDRVDKQMRGVN